MVVIMVTDVTVFLERVCAKTICIVVTTLFTF